MHLTNCTSQKLPYTRLLIFNYSQTYFYHSNLIPTTHLAVKTNIQNQIKIIFKLFWLLLLRSRAGMSNSNYHAGLKSHKNYGRGRKCAQKALLRRNSLKIRLFKKTLFTILKIIITSNRFNITNLSYKRTNK